MLNPNIQVTVNHKPFAIILKNIFPEQVVEEILSEIVSNKDNFKTAQIAEKNGDSKTDLNYRSNQTSFFDELYMNRRNESKLISYTTELINSSLLADLLNSAPYPLCNFTMTDTHETQVSRYGNSDEKYDWHIDRLGNTPKRVITVSMYFCKEPKQFKGGEIILSDGLVHDGKVYGEEKRLEFPVENNSCVIFNSRTPHCVMPTQSPEEFDAGRFSVQLWLGKEPMGDWAIQELAKMFRSGLS